MKAKREVACSRGLKSKKQKKAPTRFEVGAIALEIHQKASCHLSKNLYVDDDFPKTKGGGFGLNEGTAKSKPIMVSSQT